MPATQYYCAASLDGYIADPEDGLDWLTGYDGAFEHPAAEPGPMAEGGAYARFYDGVGALVSGSTTYEWLLEHVPGWPYAGKPYWVLSTRDLTRPEGADVRVTAGAVADLHAEMLASANGRNLWVVGGGPVASEFAEAGLLDELHLTVVPVVLGAGKPLFERPLPAALALTGTRLFDDGMVELRHSLTR